MVCPCPVCPARGQEKEELNMGKGYFTEVRITDFGPSVTKIILPMGAVVKM